MGGLAVSAWRHRHARGPGWVCHTTTRLTHEDIPRRPQFPRSAFSKKEQVKNDNSRPDPLVFMPPSFRTLLMGDPNDFNDLHSWVLQCKDEVFAIKRDDETVEHIASQEYISTVRGNAAY